MAVKKWLRAALLSSVLLTNSTLAQPPPQRREPQREEIVRTPYRIEGAPAFQLRNRYDEENIIESYAINVERRMFPTLVVSQPSKIKFRFYPLLKCPNNANCRELEEEKELKIEVESEGGKVERSIRGVSRPSPYTSEVVERSNRAARNNFTLLIGTPIEGEIEIKSRGKIVFRKPNGFLEIIEVRPLEEREPQIVREQIIRERVVRERVVRERVVERRERQEERTSAGFVINAIAPAYFGYGILGFKLSKQFLLGVGFAAGHTYERIENMQGDAQLRIFRAAAGPAAGIAIGEHRILLSPMAEIEYVRENVSYLSKENPRGYVRPGGRVALIYQSPHLEFYGIWGIDPQYPLTATVLGNIPWLFEKPLEIETTVAVWRRLEFVENAERFTAETRELEMRGYGGLTIPIIDNEFVPSLLLRGSYENGFGGGGGISFSISLGEVKIDARLWYEYPAGVRGSVLIRGN